MLKSGWGLIVNVSINIMISQQYTHTHTHCKLHSTVHTTKQKLINCCLPPLGFFFHIKLVQQCSSFRGDSPQRPLNVHQRHTAKSVVWTGSGRTDIHWSLSIGPWCCAQTPCCSSLCPQAGPPIHLAHLNSNMGDLRWAGWTVTLHDKTAN